MEIIYFLECAVAEGVLSAAESRRARTVADGIPFPLLSFDHFFSQLGSCENGLLNSLSTFFEHRGAAFFSIKQKDATELLAGFRAILAGRSPAHVRETYRQACETYMSRLHRKYADGYDLSLPKDWLQEMPMEGAALSAPFLSNGGNGVPPSRQNTQPAGRRALPAADTCRLAEAFFSDLDVIVADTTGYDPPAGSFIINIFFPPLYFLGYPLSCSTGNGDVFEEALAAAYMELVERIPTHNFRIDAVRSDQLDQDPMASERIPQYYNFAASPLVKQQVVQDHGYVRVTEVFSGRHFMIPRFAVMSMFTGTDGNAAGNTLTEAILYGIYELAERDTNQLYQYDPVCRQQMPRLRIDPRTLSDRRIQALLQRFSDKGLKVALFLLPNTFDLPCIRCQVYDLNREIECHGSTAVRSDFQAAVFATLHEAYMQHISYFTGIRDDYRSLQSLKEAHIAYQNARESLGLGETPSTGGMRAVASAAGQAVSFATIPEELNHVMERLKAAGMTCMLVADTSPEDAFVVKSVKVIIPGMELWFVPEYQPSAHINRRAQLTRTIMERV